ncbi:30S ribosomal protein S20 [Desulfurivibrio sp. C05AmB]|uniref:30S ribosomal protein S20 n=1 Tax=Desulfurivibrio sp. C05AmB TaxID=3374371 RepID=UPI00376F184D
MANHKSAMKRNRQNVVRRERNRANRSRLKTLVRRVNEAVAGNAPEQAREALQAAVPMIAKAVNKGTIHRNTAARKVSRLSRRVNSLARNA